MKMLNSLKHIALACCFALLVAGCDQVSLADSAREKMSSLCSAGQLSTAEYTVEKVIKASDCAWWKVGDRKILFSCRAYLEGGIDLAKYDPAKTVVDEGSKAITIVLPKPELLSFNMPADEIQLKYTKVTGFRMNYSATERTDVLRQGEADIRADIPNLGILDDAETNATTYFTALFKQLGFKEINIKYE